MVVFSACASKGPADAPPPAGSAVPDSPTPTPSPVQEVAQDEECDEEDEAGDDVPVKWASADGKVLVRWFGRAAAGLSPYDPDAENGSTVLPGNPSAPAPLTSPALSIERRTLPNGSFQALEFGVQRIVDEDEAEDLIGKDLADTDWWGDIAAYAVGYNQAAAAFQGDSYSPQDPITLDYVYDVFDHNPMAALSWANKYHEIALLLGMGYLDTDVQNGDQVALNVITVKQDGPRRL